MALFTRCILSRPDLSDGFRISVMSRHTLNDGITQDIRIRPDNYRLHLPMLAPSPKLIGDYYKRGMHWDDFHRRYLDEISQAPKFGWALWLSTRALVGDVTVLCIEESASFCHRRLLAEFCLALEPGLHIEHR